jgi:hypothetical protein
MRREYDSFANFGDMVVSLASRQSSVKVKADWVIEERTGVEPTTLYFEQ